MTYWQAELAKIVEAGKPAVGLHDLAWRGQPLLSLLWLRLPLSSNGKDVDMIIGYDAVVSMAVQGMVGAGEGESLSSGSRAA